jgi:hypothetical protein
VTPSKTSRAGAHTLAHVVHRLVIDADATFEDLRGRYESLVPEIDPDELRTVIEKGDLDEVARYTAEHTPHTFARFALADGHVDRTHKGDASD